MAITRDSIRLRLEALRLKMARDTAENVKELDRILLDHVAGGISPPTTDGAGGHGEER